MLSHNAVGEIVQLHSSHIERHMVRLGGALGDVVWWKVSLPVSGGLEIDDLPNTNYYMMWALITKELNNLFYLEDCVS